MAGRRPLEIAASDTSGTDSGRAMRALLSLGVSELRKGDTLAARRRARRISEVAGAGDYSGLARLLDAALEASAGDYVAALRTNAPLIHYDALNKVEQPFARSAAHLLRADWFERSGDLAAASRELVGHENEDLEGLPAGAAQAAEVDWVFAAFARLRQARIELAMDNAEGACRHVAEVVRIWNWPEPALGRWSERPGSYETRRAKLDRYHATLKGGFGKVMCCHVDPISGISMNSRIKSSRRLLAICRVRTPARRTCDPRSWNSPAGSACQ